MPFLLLRLPEMAAEDDEDSVMLQGWGEPAVTVESAAPGMTMLEKAVDMYTRRRIMLPQGDDFLLELSDDMKARVVARAWQEMGSPEKVNVRDLQAELVRLFEAEGGEIRVEEAVPGEEEAV
jgi:hypothetical protein